MQNPRILFIAEGQLGDLLILTPALRATKATFPNSLLAVLVAQRRRYSPLPSTAENVLTRQPGAGTAAVLTDNPYVDEVIEVDRSALRPLKGLTRIKTELEVIKLLRSKKFDIVICTFPEDRFVLWAFASGARVRVGQKQQPLSWLLTHKPDIQKQDLGVLRYYCHLAAAAGATISSFDTEYRIPVTAKEWAADLLRAQGINSTTPLVAIHPGGSGPYNLWPPERFAAIADAIQIGGNTKVILCGTEFDETVVDELKNHLRAEVIAVNFGQSVARFAAILERCALCISNDSGPRHLAVAVGTPSVAFMRRGQDRQWKIYHDERASIVLQSDEPCRECRDGSCRDLIPSGEKYGAYCMRMISVDRALETVARFIKN